MANGTINAIQYFIRIKDSLNEWATCASPDKEIFTSLVDEHLSIHFMEGLDVDYYAGIEDDEEYKEELAKAINEIIDEYNQNLKNEVTNDPIIGNTFISDLRSPGDIIGFKHK